MRLRYLGRKEICIWWPRATHT